MLAVLETHPIQYHAPVYRALQQDLGVPVTAIYASDFSVVGYHDREFQTRFAWDTDLLSGYDSVFLSRVRDGGAANAESASTDGLRAAIADLRPAAVLVGGYSPRFHRAAWLDAWRSGAPVLFRGETNDSAYARGWMKDQARATALALAYRTCARLLYIGERSRQHFIRLGVDASRLVFSPYCVDTTPFQPEEADRTGLRRSIRAAMGIDDDRFVVLFSGKLSRRKGVDLVIDAVRALPDGLRSKTVIALLGEGDERSRLESQAAALPGVALHFLGFRRQREMSACYHAADMLVLPSRSGETWGLVVNEALHHGVPCVVSDRVGSAPDLIAPGVTGDVFPAEDAAALARAIETTSAICGLAQTREACRRRVAGYTVRAAAKGIATAYDAVAGNIVAPSGQVSGVPS
jgi:glycosyltransferase involved in cell wall biosynthesis